MRVSSKMIADNVAENLFKQSQQIMKTREMISSGKRINKPSDDPIGIGRVLNYRKTLSSIDQYQRNITQGKTHLNLIETTLGEIDNLIVKAKQWAADLSTGSSDNQTRNIALQNVKNIYDQIFQLANTKMGNSYMFAGHKTDTAPFSRNADGIDGTADDYVATYNGDNGNFSFIIGEGIDTNIQSDGKTIFQTGTDVFNVLNDLIDGINNDDVSKISDQIQTLSDASDQINRYRAEGATVYQRLETTENHLGQFKLNIENMLSNTEDADMTKAIVDLQALQTTYEISLSTAAKVIQPSLVNFLS